jgi:hypothetical protein
MFIASTAPQHCLCSSFLLLSQFFQTSAAKMTTLPVILCLIEKCAVFLNDLWVSRVKMTRLLFDDKLVGTKKQEVRYEIEEMAFWNRSFLLPADEYAVDACRNGRGAG